MKEYLTPDRIANSILQKTRFKGTYLVVEGNSDYTLYKKFTLEAFCTIEIAFGNSNVIGVIDELNSRGFKDVIGIIDSDFRNLDGNIPENKDVFMTDDHDIELMIIRSPAFEAVINHHCEESKLNVFLKTCDDDLRTFFLKLAAPLGYLKWVNKTQNFNLVFKPHNQDGRELNYSNFIPARTMAFEGYNKMIETVINYSVPKGKINTNLDDAITATQQLIKEDTDLYQLCNGHDICQIIALSLRTKIASLNAKALGASQIERELIFAYDSRFFVQTQLYASIKSWEKFNNKLVLAF